jgi:hypothetical protein
VVHLGTGPIAAQGEMPIGLLDPAASVPALRSAERRY